MDPSRPDAPDEARRLEPADLVLLHLDADLVAIDKPAGLLVHPSGLDAHETLTATGLLAERLGARVAPLHRLDKGTSGVLLFARHADAAAHGRRAFDEGRVRKRYVALVRGWPLPRGEIDEPLARDPERPSAGQPRLAALTRWRRLARHDWPFATDARHPGSRFALVEVEPVTGRRHQIRRHFKRLAHPLVGDATHGKGPLNRAAAAWLGVSRLWLHAAAIELPTDAGPLRIEAPAGPEWARLWGGLGP